MKLRYNGDEPLDDGRFVAHKGDVVDFEKAEAIKKIENDEPWTKVGSKRKKVIEDE